MAFDQTDTVVSFGANTQELEAGAKRVSDSLNGMFGGVSATFENLRNAITGNVAGVNESLGGLKSGIEGLGGIFTGVAAILAGGAIFREGIKAATDEAGEVKKLMNMLGMTAEEASKMKVALELVGMSAQDYTGIALKFDRQLKSNEKGMNDLGISTRDHNGSLLKQDQLLQNAASTMMEYKAGTDRNAYALSVFGRTADEAFKLLKLNDDVKKRASELAVSIGEIMTPEELENVKKYKIEMAAVGVITDAFAENLGGAVIPGLTQMATAFVEIGTIVMPDVKGALDLLGIAFTGIGKVIRKFVEESIDLFSQFRTKADETFRDSGPETLSIYERVWQLTANGINDLIYSLILGMDKLVMETKATVNDIGGLWNVFSSGMGTKAGDAADLEWQQKNLAIRKAGHAKIIADELAYRVEMEKIAGAHREIPELTKEQAASTEWANQSMGGRKREFKGGDGKGGKGGKGAGAEESYVPKWDAQLADAKVYYAATHDLRELSKQQEIAFWESALAQTNLTDTEKIEIQRKVSKLRLEIQKEERKEALGLATEGIKAEQAAAMAGLSYDEEIAKTKYDLNQTSFEEYQNQLTAFENRRYEIEKAAQEKLIELDKSSPNNAVKVKQDKDKLIALEQTHSLNYLKIVGATTKEAAAKWQTLYKSISDGLGSSVAGFIVGTKSLSTALSGIYTSIQGAFEKMIGDMISKWITGQLTMLFVKESTNASIESADALAATAAAINAKVQASMQIPAIAGVAAGEAAASQAGIPVVGPALAATAYAETMAMVMSGLALASASGGYDIPAGVNPLTQLHQNEMVLPAHLADSVRSMSGKGRSNGGDTNIFHIQATDAPSFRKMLDNEGAFIADVFKKQIRNFKR